MTAVKRFARNISSLVPPGAYNIVELADRASGSPKKVKRTPDTTVRIGFVIFQINRCRSPVVFANGVNGIRIVITTQIFFESPFFYNTFDFDLTVYVVMQEIFRIKFDKLFRKGFRLN